MTTAFEEVLTSICYKGTEETFEDIIAETQRYNTECQITELLIKQELGVLV